MVESELTIVILRLGLQIRTRGGEVNDIYKFCTGNKLAMKTTGVVVKTQKKSNKVVNNSHCHV